MVFPQTIQLLLTQAGSKNIRTVVIIYISNWCLLHDTVHISTFVFLQSLGELRSHELLVKTHTLIAYIVLMLLFIVFVHICTCLGLFFFNNHIFRKFYLIWLKLFFVDYIYTYIYILFLARKKQDIVCGPMTDLFSLLFVHFPSPSMYCWCISAIALETSYSRLLGWSHYLLSPSLHGKTRIEKQ